MPAVKCPECNLKVVPMTGGNCPACNSVIAPSRALDSTAAPTPQPQLADTTEKPIEDLASSDHQVLETPLDDDDLSTGSKLESSEILSTRTFIIGNRSGKVKPALVHSSIPGLQTGTILSERYELEEEIGRGGMGKVFSGRDIRLGRKVAVKIIRPDLTSDLARGSRLKALFEDEARTGANLVHPSIATIYDFGVHCDVPFAVFEFVAGQTLHKHIKRQKKIPLADAQLIIADLSQALDFAHSRGIVHRDLKPENIRLDVHGKCRILDLGLAKDFRSTSDWSFSGTPAYAAPEQILEQASDGRTDQYALALIAFEMLVGRPVFQAKDWRTMLDMQTGMLPVLPDDVFSFLPKNIGQSILRALEKNPNQRFESCEEFAFAFGCPMHAERFLTGRIADQIDVKMVDYKLIGRYSRFSTSPAPNGAKISGIRLVLGSEELWIGATHWLERWPFHSINSVGISERTLRLAVKFGATKNEFNFHFPDTQSCKEWESRLQSEKEKSLASPTEESTIRRTYPLMVSTQPDVRLQVLGHLESQDKSKALAKFGLQMQAAVHGADAVIGLGNETLPKSDKTLFRVSGTVVRFADSASRSEFQSRSFLAELNRVIPVTVALLIFLPLVLVATAGPNFSLVLEGPYAAGFWGYATLACLWPLFATILLWRLKWPQLIKGTAISILGFSLQPLIVLGSAICVSFYLSSENFVRSVSSIVANPKLIICAVLGLSGTLLGFRYWSAFPKSESKFAVPKARRVISFATQALSFGYVVTILVICSLVGFFIAEFQSAGRRDFYNAALSAEAGNFDSAITLLNKSIAENPSYDALNLMADILIQKEDFSSAFEYAGQAVALREESALGYVIRAQALIPLEEWESALSDCNSAIRLGDESNLVFELRSEVFANTNKLDLALQDVNRAISIAPDSFRAYAIRGFVQLQKRQYSKCISDCSKALQISPDFKYALWIRGQAYEASGNDSAAKADFKDASSQP